MTWPIASVACVAMLVSGFLLWMHWAYSFRRLMRITDGEAAKLADQHEQLVAKLKALEEKLTIINNRQR